MRGVWPKIIGMCRFLVHQIDNKARAWLETIFAIFTKFSVKKID